MGVWLSRRFRSPDRVFPALPFDFSFDMAPVGRPEHRYVQRHGGHAIKDEGEGVLVTGKIKTLAGLAGNQQQNSQEQKKRRLQSPDNQQKRNQKEGSIPFTVNRTGKS